jgi:DNA replication and repair protein RecF
LSLTLKLAELSAIREARGAHPILLLDDVSSELDPTRTFAVYAFLQQSPGQVFVTTTRPELFETPGAQRGDRRDYRLIGGALDPTAERAGGA